MFERLLRFLGARDARKMTRVRRGVQGGYRAVEVKPGAKSCKAAQAISGIRYLARDAPLLPRPDCRSVICDCRYMHYDDRRRSSRRDADVGMLSRYVSDERRRGHGRRSSDNIGGSE